MYHFHTSGTQVCMSCIGKNGEFRYVTPKIVPATGNPLFFNYTTPTMTHILFTTPTDNGYFLPMNSDLHSAQVMNNIIFV